MNLLLKTKFEKVSHIYSISKTSRPGEFAIGGYDGLYFGQINSSHIGITTEVFLPNKTVKCVKEYGPNRFIVGIDNYPAYVLVDRIAMSPSE